MAGCLCHSSVIVNIQAVPIRTTTRLAVKAVDIQVSCEEAASSGCSNYYNSKEGSQVT